MTTISLLITLLSLSLFTISTAYNHICDPTRYAELGLNMADFSFCDKSLPYDVRVKDLVDRMTVAEKVQNLGHRNNGAHRLGLPKYNWWSEALHGVSNVGSGTHFNQTVPAATSFPTVILTTASFNETLWKTIGQVVSTEARAMYNVGLAGLTFWSPNVNVVRDPRWGRTTETPGEDPFVVGRYAANYVRGLQDVERCDDVDDLNSRPLKVSACCKHYAAYDVDAWLTVDRYHFDARVTEQDMVETFLRPFEMCIKEGDVSSVMCSYNRVDGIPACADSKLLKQTIRDEWDLHGYIVSDCDSIQVMHDNHRWLNETQEEAAAQVLRAGLDLDCGDYYPKYTLPAIREGKAREGDVDKALKNLYMVLMRLGYFDGNPAYESLGKDDVCTKEHIELAADAARQGIVLLKNENNTLPLDPTKYKKILVTGPHANATTAMIGNYAGIPCRYVTPVEGFSSYAKVHLARGCYDVKCTNSWLIHFAVDAVRNEDASIILVGLDLSIEAESRDRTDLLLPGYQTELINKVADAAAGPVILVILSAGGVDISFAKNNPKIKAILWAGYPGAEGGQAIADVVYGKYNPGGKLPLTWYNADYVDQLPITSMRLRPVDELGYPGRTYKFYNGSTVYPFGYGLSYTRFNYDLKCDSQNSITQLLAPHQHCHDMLYTPSTDAPPCPAVVIDDLDCSHNVDIVFEVNNIGDVDGTHVVLIYTQPPKNYVGLPLKQLVSFERVFVNAGQSRKRKISLNVCKSFAVVSHTAYTVLPYGEHTVVIGDGDEALYVPVHVDFSY